MGKIAARDLLMYRRSLAVGSVKGTDRGKWLPRKIQKPTGKMEQAAIDNPFKSMREYASFSVRAASVVLDAGRYGLAMGDEDWEMVALLCREAIARDSSCPVGLQQVGVAADWACTLAYLLEEHVTSSPPSRLGYAYADLHVICDEKHRLELSMIKERFHGDDVYISKPASPEVPYRTC